MQNGEPERKNKFFVQSLHRTFEIIDIISEAEGKGVNVTEISKKIKLPISTVYRLLQNLIEGGYVEEIDGCNYILGLKFLELGVKVQKNIDIRNVARDFLEKLNEETKETIYVAKFDPKQLNIIYIEKIQSKRNITLTAGIGSRNYVHSTANGKCLLSGFSDEKIIEILKKTGMPSLTDYTIVDAEQYLEEIRKVRQDGYAIDDRENENDVRCISSPIFDHENKVTAAVSISGVINNMDLELMHTKYRDLIIETARSISEKLGYWK